jgi:hypothetical protein
MKLHLNLCTAPQENRRPFLAGATLIGAISAIALVFLSQAAYHSWRSNRVDRANIAELERQIRDSSARQAQLAAHLRSPEVERVLDRANFLNSLIGERSFPWTKIFAALEETLPEGVRVVNIAPKLINGRAEVALTIGAANDQQKVRFLEAMEKSKAFSNIQITSERRTDDPNAADQILLELKAVYETT